MALAHLSPPPGLRTSVAAEMRDGQDDILITVIIISMFSLMRTPLISIVTHFFNAGGCTVLLTQ